MLDLTAFLLHYEESRIDFVPFDAALQAQIIEGEGEALIATREGDNLSMIFKGDVNVALGDVYNYMTVFFCNVSFHKSAQPDYTSVVRCKAHMTLREALAEHAQGLLDEYEQDLDA